MSDSIRVRIKLDHEVATVRVLIKHPMETGSRVDGRGDSVPAHYIDNVSCDLNGERVLSAYCGPGIAKNPYFSFRLNGANPGDLLRISWTDNRSGSDSLSATVEQ